MHYFSKTLLGLVFLLCFYKADAKVLLVNSLNDSGPGTLRDQIAAAASGDTVLMNIKGVINLNTTITINKKIRLLGAFPIHNEINGAALGGGAAFEVNAPSADTVFINGFRFSNCSGNVGAVFVSTGSTARIIDCVFKNNSGSAFGQAVTIATNSKAEIFNCSFINNATTNQGGAVSLNAASSVAGIRNCTFSQNSAPANGGAINNTGNLSVGNCTFFNNNCPSGADIRNSGGTVEIYNNIFSNPISGSQLASSIGLWNNQGGNVYSENSATYFTIVGSPVTDDFVNNQASIQLAATSTIDGYGLEYFKIAQQTSPCVDNGVLSAPVLPNDCRRAPRQLHGGNALLPDAGAVEFTPHTVTGNTPASFLAKWVAMDGSILPGTRYMDFDITGGGPVTFNMTATLSSSTISVHYMVDGFTQAGSVIPGPGIVSNGYTPANYMINIINNATDIFYWDNPGSLSFIAGLNMDNGGGTAGIHVNDGGIHIYGNHLISTSISGSVGILLTGVNNATIGGPLHHYRNVIGNQLNAGVHAQNDQTNFQGNFIGTDALGTSALANQKGILAQTNTVMIFGKYRFPSMNLISGNSTSQIEIASGFFDIRGNIIGPQVDGNSIMAATVRGIEVGPGTTGFIGSANPGDLNVIGGNDDGILLNGADGVTILQNFIGISPNPGFASIPNATGINITNNGASTHMIGNGSIKARNYICANSSMGIYMQDANNHTLMGNFIGIKPDNTLAGNGTRGIHLVGAGTQGNDILGNIIGGHSLAGIDVNGTSGAGNISGNKIGSDSLGLVARPNAIGINVAATPIGSQIIGNLISGNINEGIFIDNSPITIDDNIIGIDLDTVIALSNGGNGIILQNTASSFITNNIIGGNGGNGILLDVSINNIIRGNLIGTNRIGMDFGNQTHGIALFSTCANTTIGGPASADHNSIMFNVLAGIDVEPEVSTTAIIGNHFFQNGAHGITFNRLTNPSLPLANDLNDSDVSGSGAGNFGNDGQNYPDLNSCNTCGASVVLSGTMNVDNPFANYILQVYKVLPGNVDASGHGEGDSLLASTTINSPGVNTFSFSINIPTASIGDILSTTCTKENGSFATSEFSDTIIVRGPATASITGAANVSCFGASDGQATATHGGTAPFTYDWINAGTGTTTGLNTQSVNSLPPGMYYCSVTDANCTVFTDTVLITEPSQLLASVSPTNPTCFATCDGVLVLTESGGVAVYQYSIDNGLTFQASNTFNGLCAGGYQYVILDGNGCMTPTGGNIVNLFSPGAISVSPTVNNESCDGMNDGIITLSAAGGNGGFTYQLAGGGFGAASSFGGLAPGSYTYDVMDANGCISSGVATVNSGNVVTADFSVSTTNGCQNTFDFDFTDASNFGSSTMDSLVWSFPSGSPSSGINVTTINNVMLFNSGANSVSLHAVAIDGCYHDTTIFVTVNPAVFADAGIDTTICVGTPFTHVGNTFGGTSGFSYSWSPAGNFVTATVEDPSVTAGVSNTTGNYIHVMNVTDANGCFDLDSVIVTVVGLPAVSAGADFSVCQGNSATLSGGGSATSFSWDNSVINASPFVPASTLTYTVTGTDANGCTNTDQIVVTVEIPYVINAGTDFNVCENVSTLVLAGTTNSPTHLWTQNNGAGGMANATALTATYTLTGVDTIQTTLDFIFSAPANGACPAIDDTLFVTLDDMPMAEAGNSPPNLCNNAIVTFNGIVINSATQNWITPGFGTFTTPTSLNTDYAASPSDIGLVYFYLSTGTNGTCPSHTDSVSVTFLDAPIANAGIDAIICNGQTFSLDGTASTGTINTWSWDEVSGPNIGSNPIEIVAPTVTTDYALTVDNGSCNDFDTMTITVNAPPDASFNYATTSYCQNAVNEAPSIIVTAGGVFSLPASPGSINTATGLINFSTLAIGNYNVYYTLSTPCTSVDSVVLTILAPPVVFAGNDTSICVGSPINLNGFPSGGTSYAWSGTNGFGANVQNTSDTPLVTTMYTLTVLAGGCVASDDIDITVNQAPSGNITGGGTYCEGDPNAVLTITSSTSNYDLDILQNGSSFVGPIISPANPYNILVNSISDGGTYTAILTDDVTGCFDTLATSVTIVINPEPNVSVASPISMCENTLSFDLNTTLSPLPAGGAWTGSGVSGSTFDPASAGAGTHDLVYTLSGCDDTIIAIINTIPNVIVIGIANAYCQTDPPFTPTGTPAGGDWSQDGGTFGPLTSVDPSTLSVGTHSLSYQFTDGITGCVGTSLPQTFTVSSMPLDPVITSPLTQTICSGGTVTLTATNPNTGNGSIIWFADLGLTNQIGLGPTYVSPPLTGSTNIYMAIVNAGCNTSINVFTITVNNAQVSAGADMSICPGTQAQLNVTSATGTISWSPGSSLSDSTITNPIATPNVNTTYVVTVVSGPCVDTDTVNVIVDGSNPNCGFIPSYNAFSPDGDGVNDTWIIDAALLHPDNTVTVFNRWGDKLVSFEDYNNVTVVWDGMYKGNLLPSGTYFYVIEYHDINQQVSSWVQLTR